MKLIPIKYHSKRYPEHITSTIEEVAGNFDKDNINTSGRYSLHTEYSHMARKFSSKSLDGLNTIKESHKDNIPLLWKNKEWAKEFTQFLINFIGDSRPPEIIEIHPPFKFYCENIDDFIETYRVFENIIINKYPDTRIFIENRFGTLCSGVKFLISSGKDIIELAKKIKENNLKLRIVLDYPQLFSAEKINMNDIKLDRILDFNDKIKQYKDIIGGFHMWGKKKNNNGRWLPHNGDLNTFFSNNDELKMKFLESFINTYDDKKRFFVPEVNSKGEDLISIIQDMEKAGFIFEDN